MYARAFNSLKLITFTLLIGLVSHSSFAQVSSGEMLQRNRELEPSATTLPGLVKAPSSIDLKPLTPQPGQLSFVVKHFIFKGNTKVSSEKLEASLKEYLNKPITFEDLNRVTDIITEQYRAHGWVVRAVIPQQDITEGTIVIHLIEAKLGGIKIDNQSTVIGNQEIESWIYSHIPKSTDLSLNELDRAVLTLDDLPDVSVSSSLASGEEVGETLLLLNAVDRPWYSGQAALDNFGDRNSGRVRGSALVNLNGLSGMGQQLSVYGTYTEGNNYGHLSFNFPVGTDGLRLGANTSSMSYRVINPSFASLAANGTSDSAGIEANYPIIRSRPANLMGTFSWTYNQFKNWNLNGLNQDSTYNTNVAQLGVSGNLIDELFDGGVNNGSINLSMGNNGRDPAGQYNSNYQVAGRFYKLRYSLSRNQVIDPELTANVSITGQFANKNMDSSEQFYLSGPTNVRGYISGGAATQGHLLSFELRQLFPYQLQGTAFYDLGEVQAWKNNNPTANTLSNNYLLQSAGFSLLWMGPYNSTLKTTLAMRVGSLDESIANNLNQTGALARYRIWFNFSLPL